MANIMQTDWLTISSLVLSIVSITLAIVSAIFAWVSYKNSTAMQMKAQAILEQVSQKVEVIVKLTASQIERAWDYVMQNRSAISGKDEQINFNVDELSKKILIESKEETEKLIKDSGIDKAKIDSIVSQLETLIDKTTEKTKDVYTKQAVLEKYLEIENELKKWFERKVKWVFPPNILMPEMLHNQEISSVLPKNMLKEIKYFIEIRNFIVNSKPVMPEEIEVSLKKSEDILFFLRNT